MELEGSYRMMAAFMWGIVAVVAGVTLGSFMQWQGRQLGFAILLMVGLYGLGLMRWNVRGSKIEGGSNPVGVAQEQDQELLPGKVNGAVDEEADMIATLLAESRDLSEEEICKWLDSFLKVQQKS